jgi:hypothetical protein
MTGRQVEEPTQVMVGNQLPHLKPCAAGFRGHGQDIGDADIDEQGLELPIRQNVLYGILVAQEQIIVSIPWVSLVHEKLSWLHTLVMNRKKAKPISPRCTTSGSTPSKIPFASKTDSG